MKKTIIFPREEQDAVPYDSYMHMGRDGHPINVRLPILNYNETVTVTHDTEPEVAFAFSSKTYAPRVFVGTRNTIKKKASECFQWVMKAKTKDEAISEAKAVSEAYKMATSFASKNSRPFESFFKEMYEVFAEVAERLERNERQEEVTSFFTERLQKWYSESTPSFWSR